MAKIIPVQSAKDLKAFIQTPAALHANDPSFIARLNFEMSDHLSRKNPYFDHAKAQFFVAKDDDGKPLGRISAQIDALAQKDGEPLVGHFGFIEADRPENLSALLSAAENWLKKEGVKSVRGPFSLSINDESGLLVDGFDSPPRLMMNHASSWYAGAIEEAGYNKAKDLIAFDMDVEKPLPKAAQNMARMASDNPEISERPLNMKAFHEDLGIILDLFNKAWVNNWGFIPMTDQEIAYTARNMQAIINPDLARLVFIDGKPAAMIVALPDVNEAVRDLQGKILPFGWAKLLWRLKMKGLSGGRVLLMGVHPDYQGTPMGAGLCALLFSKLQEAAQKAGMKQMELSWILEDNQPIIRLIEAMGAKPYKTYRIYEKDLK